MGVPTRTHNPRNAGAAFFRSAEPGFRSHAPARHAPRDAPPDPAGSAIRATAAAAFCRSAKTNFRSHAASSPCDMSGSWRGARSTRPRFGRLTPRDAAQDRLPQPPRSAVTITPSRRTSGTARTDVQRLARGGERVQSRTRHDGQGEGPCPSTACGVKRPQERNCLRARRSAAVAPTPNSMIVPGSGTGLIGPWWNATASISGSASSASREIVLVRMP